MDNVSTTASRSSSFSSLASVLPPNPKYKQLFADISGWFPNPRQRIEANQSVINEKKEQIKQKLNSSHFFESGKQQKDDHFREIFIDFFRELRGGDPLATNAACSLADHFRGYKDVSRRVEDTMDSGDFSDIKTTLYLPTKEVIAELKKLLEEEYGLRDQLLGALDQNGKKLHDFAKLEDRDLFLTALPKDHSYRKRWGLQTAPVYIPLSVVARLFPKCIAALKEIFNNLLIAEWLHHDINGVKLYLQENDFIERPLRDEESLQQAITLWETAKYYSEKQKDRDIQLSKKHRNELKDDLCGVMMSGGLSFMTGNPSFVVGQAAKTMMNSFGNKIDPEAKDSGVQVLKLFGGAGVGGALGGNAWDLGTALGIDLMEIANRAENSSKKESALRNLGGSVLKGTLTGDKKKFVCQILGVGVSEALNQLPDTNEDTPLDIRIARALLTNSDVQSHYIKQYVDQRFKDDPKPKVGGILTPEEQEKYLKQEPTLEDLKQQAEYEKQLAEYEKWQKDVKLYEQESANREEAITQKERDVKQSETKMLDKWNKYEKAKGVFSSGDKEFNAYWKKRETYKKLSGELNTLKAQQGLPQEDPFKKFIRKPSPPKGIIGVLDKAYEGVSKVAKKIGLSGEMPVGSMNLYETRPSTVSDRHVSMEESYRPLINQPRPNLGWENVQAMQQEQMFNANMARSSNSPQPLRAAAPQSPINYQQFWGQGVRQNIQMPPMELSALGRNPVEHQIPGMKHYPSGDRTQSNIPKWLRYFASAGETLDPQERIDRNTQALVATTKMAAQAFGEIADELRSFGCINAKFDHGKVTLKFDRTISSQIDGLMNQYLPNMDHVPNFRYVEFTARIANDVMLQAFMMPLFQVQRARPLLDRALVRPQGFGQQLRAIEGFQQPALRSGFVSDGTVARLTEREIKAITPFKLPSVQSGSELTWLSENAPKITQLKQVKGHRFDRCLKSTFRDQNLSENQVRRILNYSGFNTYVIPEGIPKNVIVEFAKKNGGMNYRKFGAIPDENLIVRVCPGLAKESVVSSYINGGIKNGTLRQQTPYVVQTRGNLTLTTQSEWVDLSLEKNKWKKALAHIPLETYEFKGW